ncbi:MAG TPA: hypothetical protein VFY65_15790 [Longimicrobium sp.]|nr:hypothetical protein [Longimicrobium sp.]
MMTIVVLAVLRAAPLSAQAPPPAPSADAWRSMPVIDPRLRADFGSVRRNSADARVAEVRMRMGLPHWMLLGGVVGCAGGALVMGSGAEDGETAAARFNGCILGGAAGMFLGGVYGLATGG